MSYGKTAILYQDGPSSNIDRAYFGKDSPLIKGSTIMANIYQDKSKKKTAIKDIRSYVEESLVPALSNLDVDILLIGDADYFKVLTGMKNAEPYLGYAVKSKYEDFMCFYIPNYKRLMYDPDNVMENINYVFGYYKDFLKGKYEDPGSGIIKHSWYPKTTKEIKEALDILLTKDVKLACDIEAYSLKHTTAGLGTISFSWDSKGGIAFPVDYITNHQPNTEVRALLAEFFRKFKNKIVFHGITYDVYVMIYQLFMETSIDTKGMLEGMQFMLSNFDCTKIISYLALNSCSRPNLSLKDLAQEFAGNWAVESEAIKDIRTIPLDDLLKYNLIDTMSTYYVLEKYEPIMDQDNQREIYETIFKPAAIDIIQMQLTGLPLNMDKVKSAKKQLEDVEAECFKTFNNNIYVNMLEAQLNQEWVDNYNNTRKVKRVTLADANERFNPNSNPQLQKLLYEIMNLPVLDYTASKQPATGGKLVKQLLDLPLDEPSTELLEALSEYMAISKILSSFIPAMEAAHKAEDGWHYLHGFFNLGGTVSGRLSSNGPNLQNLPAKGKLAKIIKNCFEAPPGWLFVGLDYASLEDRISALTTKDPNKLKVYSGHVVYEIDIDGTCHHIRDDDTIEYDGNEYTGEQFYELYTSGKL